MPKFFYRARTLEGQETTGSRDARDLHELGRVLRDEGLLLIDARAGHGGKGGKREISIPFLQRISLADRMMMTRHLAVLIDAGVDLPRALRTLSRQARSPKFRDILEALAGEIQRGVRLSEALAQHPKVFSDLYVSMIAAGEESGKMVDALQVLASQLEKQHELKSRIRGAMMYPAIVVIAMILVGIAMFVFVVPRLKSVFGDLTVNLPPQTRLIFWLSEVLVSQWYLFLAGFIAFLVGARFLWGWRHGRRLVTKAMMRTPVFKALLREIATARMARTLSSLVSAGVPVSRALTISATVVGNVYFQESLEEASRMIERGQSIHETLAQYPWVYPPLVIEMAQVGEEAGKFTEVFADLATFYEGEVDKKTQSLASIVEPILMVIIGVGVGFFVISLMQPLYSMIGQIGS